MTLTLCAASSRQIPLASTRRMSRCLGFSLGRSGGESQLAAVALRTQEPSKASTLALLDALACLRPNPSLFLRGCSVIRGLWVCIALLQHPADPPASPPFTWQGYIPLQWAALNNRVAESTYLLSNGADINAADPTGQTALHWAAVRGSLPVLETLLRNGADANLADARGYTVCHVAAQVGWLSTCQLMELVWYVCYGWEYVSLRCAGNLCSC